MNPICRLLAVAALSVVASAAQAETPAENAAGAATPAPPIPTLLCDFKQMVACSPDGTCKEDSDVAGMKLPVKTTVDFENSVVAAVDESGYARTDKFDGVAESAEQLIMHGIDDAFGWQLLIHKNSEHASMSFVTADTAIIGFGTCAKK